MLTGFSIGFSIGFFIGVLATLAVVAAGIAYLVLVRAAEPDLDSAEIGRTGVMQLYRRQESRTDAPVDRADGTAAVTT